MVASVGRITAGTGYRYLADEVATSKHDYYAGRGEAPGVWAGSGSAELGLAGVVDVSDMDALYGRFVDPRTAGGAEVVLGRKVSARVVNAGTPREHVSEPLAALDVTFSPSKSVSALWAAHPSEIVRQAVLDAHDAAVDDALGYLEDNAGHTRTGAGGLRRIESNGFIVAKFRHRTARSTDPGARVGDPQLHTHCAILNRVHGSDGVWRTVDSKAIYRHAHAAGALYGAVLERELTTRLGVGWVTPDPDARLPMREIRGIPDEVLSRWSSRRHQILDAYGPLLEEFRVVNGRSPTRDEVAAMKDRATVESRLPKAGGVPDLHTVWRSELAADQQTAIAGCVGAAPSDATTGGRLAADDSELRRQVVAALEHQRSWWNRTHVYAEVAKRIDAPTRESIELVTEQIVGECVCLEPDADPRYAELDATRYSSQRILDAEHEIIRTARTRADWVLAPRPDERLGEDQALAVEALTALPHRLTTIVGPAGAGKTSMLQSVAASYRAAGREVRVLTLSAAAARVVTEETGIPATTIASWQHSTAALPSAGLVLVDEASMVPTLTLQQLTRAAAAEGCRVGLVGDYAQMGSPEAGGLLRDLAELPSARRLTTVRRFREPWERRASIELQARDQTTSINYFEHERIVETTSDHAHADAAAAWFEDHRTGLDTLVVTDTNHDAAHVAARCQEHLMTADRLGERLATGADGNPIHVGDQVQTRLNTSELATSDHRRVLNRDVWTVVGRRDDGTVTAVHAGSRAATVQLTREYLGKHTVLAYATTIAGAQGRTVDAGHTVVTPRTDSASLYVGMTRGRLRNHAHVVTDGHDHDELQLGHRSGLSAFADAVVRNPDGETSATTVRRRWAEGQQDRASTRRHDLTREKATRWWHATSRRLPEPVCVAMGERADTVVAVLAGLPPSSWAAAATKALRSTDWRAPDAADHFVNELTRAVVPTHVDPTSATFAAAPVRAR